MRLNSLISFVIIGVWGAASKSPPNLSKVKEVSGFLSLPAELPEW